jgi:hypothetical protein
LGDAPTDPVGQHLYDRVENTRPRQHAERNGYTNEATLRALSDKPTETGQAEAHSRET